MNHTLQASVGEALPLLLDRLHSGNARPEDWQPAARRAALQRGWGY